MSDERYPIEDDVPVPARRYQGKTDYKYPVNRLEKSGQSFFVPYDDITVKPTSFRSYMHKTAASLGFKVTVRMEEEGYRIFREPTNA